MARDIRVFDVFVASPADVADERERLEAVIRELNETWQNRLGVQLNLVRWETHAYPGFGEDAQDVINREMQEAFDVFIGILWSRIGTQTHRAESGTLEEFERAYTQWTHDRGSIKLLMYFKKAALGIDDIDPEQISRVQAFERSLPEKGGFCWRFDTSDHFEAIVRKHLSLLAQELAEDPEGGARRAIAASPAGAPVELEDEEGLLDLVDQWTDGLDVVNGIVGKFTGSLAELGEAMQAGSAEINDLDIPHNPSRAGEAKRLINSMANRLELFADILLPETPVLEEAFGQAMKALDKAIEVAPDFGEEGIESLCTSKTGLVSFDESIGGAMESIGQMKETIQGLPRVTTRFNRAKRKAVDALGGLYRCLSAARTQMNSSHSLLVKLCDGIKQADADGRPLRGRH